MRWRKRNAWKMGIAITGTVLLLVVMEWIAVSVADANPRASGQAHLGMVTAQTTPTEDATVTALSKEQLSQQVAQQQHTWDNWLWSNAAAILSSFLSTLVIVIGALFGLWRWRRDQHTELEKRAEERFQAAVTGLADEKEGARIGAAILLRTFLRPGYEQFYTQIYDLVVANLLLPRTFPLSEESPDALRTSPPQVDPDIPLPLTTLSRALIVVFKEAFPLVRPPGRLAASSVLLDNADLIDADLEGIGMPRASLRGANLAGANLSGANLTEANLSRAFGINAKFRLAYLIKANLTKANLSATDLSRAYLIEANLDRADLSGADLSGADLGKVLDLGSANLKDAYLRGVKGLTPEQLEACKTKGATIDEDPITSSSQSTVVIFPPIPSKDLQAQPTPPTQASLSTPDEDGSDTTSSTNP